MIGLLLNVRKNLKRKFDKMDIKCFKDWLYEQTQQISFPSWKLKGKLDKPTFTVLINPKEGEEISNFKKELDKSSVVRFLAIPSSKQVFIWDMTKSTHEHVLNRIKPKLDITNCKTNFAGMAKLSNWGEFIFDSYVIVDNNLSEFTINKQGMPPGPFETREGFLKGLPIIEKSYRFVEDYIKGFKEENPFIKILRFYGITSLT